MPVIGAHTTIRSAPATASARVAAALNPALSAASEDMDRSGSHPSTEQPTRSAAAAIEVPIRPVPRTATRSIEVIAQRLRAVEVNVSDVIHRALGVEMCKDPH